MFLKNFVIKLFLDEILYNFAIMPEYPTFNLQAKAD